MALHTRCRKARCSHDDTCCATKVFAAFTRHEIDHSERRSRFKKYSVQIVYLFYLVILPSYLLEEIDVWDIESTVMENLEFPFLRNLRIFNSACFETKPAVEANMITMVSSSPALQSITIYFHGAIFQEFLRQIADHCPVLEELDLRCQFLVDDLVYLLNKC